MSIAKDRRASLFFRAVSEILSHQLTNANIANVTVTGVELSNDSKHLTIFVVFEKNVHQSFETLQNTKGFVRSQLARQVNARVTPEIIFKYDDTFEKGKRIDELIAKNKKNHS